MIQKKNRISFSSDFFFSFYKVSSSLDKKLMWKYVGHTKHHEHKGCCFLCNLSSWFSTRVLKHFYGNRFFCLYTTKMILIKHFFLRFLTVWILRCQKSCLGQIYLRYYFFSRVKDLFLFFLSGHLQLGLRRLIVWHRDTYSGMTNP